MHVPAILTLITLTLLPSLSLAQDDPAAADAASSEAEDVCYTKSLSTGSGAAAAIKGFCGQVENNDSDSDNPTAAEDIALNGYTAGGFDPSGVTTTARLAGKKGCNVGLGGEEGCLEGLWEACQKGDKLGHGSVKKGCLEFKLE
ncbi:hypothetical protein Q7P37_006514 [Cladosporium fusiforme]